MAMAQKIAAAISGGFLFMTALAAPGYSCVGRVLNLSINDSLEQKVVGQVMATYINERTGTTVNLVSNVESKDGKCSGDVCIHYLGSALAGMNDAKQAKDDQEAYSMAKEYYMEKENVVWLKPFGYKGPVEQQGSASLAVPVANRESLAKFPVLDRVINKLGDLLSDAAVQQLIEKSKNEDAAAVVKEFLKSQKLI